MKKIIFFLILFANYSFAQDEEITNWFNKESEQFLEIMNNSNVEDDKNYEKYKPYSEVDNEFKNGKYVGEWNMETAYQVQNLDSA